jgi:hypothetical protein
MFNENSNCFVDKSLDSLTVQWTSKLFDGKTAWFPKRSMNIQIVPWKNYLTPSMFNEHANCLMDKSLNFLNVQWTSNLFHGQITDFPKCSKNIQIVWWKNHLLSEMLKENSIFVMDKSLNFLNVQCTFKLFDGKITEIPACPMKIQIAWWENHVLSKIFNKHPNCFMDKSLDSLNVQWTSELFHGQIPWFPECSMNIQIDMYKSLESLNVQWTCKLLGKNRLIP